MRYNENIKLLNRKILILLIATFLTLVVFFSQFNRFSEFRYLGDAQSYIAMAEGTFVGIPVFHARRILHPWIVSKLIPFLGTDGAFLIVGLFSLFIFLYFVLIILYCELRQPLPICIALVFMPYLLHIYDYLYTQRILFISLSSIYFLLLMRKKYFISIFILFLLFLTRDEAAVIAICFCFVLLINILKNHGKKMLSFHILTTIIIAIISWIMIAQRTKTSSNIHQAPLILIYLFRLPLYFIRNFTGLEHWVDTYRALPFYPDQPLIAFQAPHWVRKVSAIKQIGFYDWNFNNVISTVLLILSSFGTLPTILFYFIKNFGYKIINISIANTVILIYACINFVSATFAASPDLIYYTFAWPVLLVTALFLKQIYLDSKIFTRIIIFHILSAWLLYVWLHASSFIVGITLIILEIFLHYYTWYLLRSVSNRLYLQST